MANALTATSTFLYCTPTAAATITSTVYTTVLPAACETGIWDATYVITDYCHGGCGGYQHPTIPPGFTVSTVHCPVCPTPEVVITCPTAGPVKPTGHGGLPPPVVTGNGVTATVCKDCGGATPTITIYETECTEGCDAPTTYPPGPVVPHPSGPVYPPGPVHPPVGPVGPNPPGSVYPPGPVGPNPPGSVYPPGPAPTGPVYPPVGPVGPNPPGPVHPPVGPNPPAPVCVLFLERGDAHPTARKQSGTFFMGTGERERKGK